MEVQTQPQLTKFEKLFLTSSNLMWAGNYIFDVILAFFIWGESETLNNLLIFKLFWSVGIVVGVFAATLLLIKIHPLIIRIVSYLFAVVLATTLLVSNITTTEALILFGGFYGFKVGLGAQPYNIIFQTLVKPENRIKYSSIESGVYETIMIFFPLLVTQIIAVSGNYNLVFILAVVLAVSSVIPLFAGLSVLSKEKTEKQPPPDFMGALKEVRESENLKNLLTLKFLYGIKSGFEVSVFPVLGLFILSDIGSWGIVNTIFAVISVLLYFTLSKRVKFSKAAPLFNVLALIYSVIALFFGIYLSLEFYLLFLFALVLDKTLIYTTYSSINAKIIDRRVDESGHLDEYMAFTEVAVFLGRVLPILVLIVAGGKIDGTAMSLLLGLVAFIPMAMTYILGRIDLLKRAEDPFIYSN